MLPSLKRTRSAPRNSTRFAAQYPARGLPCERFAAGLATRLAHHSGPRRLARPFLAEDLHLLFFRQLDWRTRLCGQSRRVLLRRRRRRLLLIRNPLHGGAERRKPPKR